MKIRYIGELLDNTGYGEAARVNVALLDALGHELSCLPIGAKSSSDPDWKFQTVLKWVDNAIEQPDVIITHIYPPKEIEKYAQRGIPLIAYVAWETDMLPSLWAYHLNKYADIVMTTCEVSKQTMEKTGVEKPVYVLGPTIFEKDIDSIDTSIPDPIEIPAGIRPIYNSNKFIFYSVFQWIERKDPTKLVSAFIQEFDATEDDVMLLMKSYRLSYEEEETKRLIASINTLNRELNIIYPPEVRLIPQRLNNKDMDTLHRMSSCYVTPHRGEGTGLGIIDAILHDNMVITTPYGGPQDFTNKESTRWLNYKMVPIQNPLYCYNYFNAYMMWADVDVFDLRKAMREAYNNRNTKTNKEALAKEYLIDTYNIDRNAEIINTVLKAI